MNTTRAMTLLLFVMADSLHSIAGQTFWRDLIRVSENFAEALLRPTTEGTRNEEESTTMTPFPKPSRFDENIEEKLVTDDDKSSEEETANRPSIADSETEESTVPKKTEKKKNFSKTGTKPSRSEETKSVHKREAEVRTEKTSKMRRVKVLSQKMTKVPKKQKVLRGRFFWPGSLEDPWPSDDRQNNFLSNSPGMVRAQQVFRLFSNSFFNGLKELFQGLFGPRSSSASARSFKKISFGDNLKSI